MLFEMDNDDGQAWSCDGNVGIFEKLFIVDVLY